MSLQGYQRLQAHSQDNEELLGNALPRLTEADIEITSMQVNSIEMLAQVKAFSAQQGWIMYRDELLISAEAPTRSDIIEGEWANNGNSLKVKLIAADCYQITHTLQKSNEQNTAYSEQKVILRNNLKGDYNTAVYRLWWQQVQEGDYNGRWLPLTQQFIGFSNDKEQK